MNWLSLLQLLLYYLSPCRRHERYLVVAQTVDLFSTVLAKYILWNHRNKEWNSTYTLER